MAIEDFLTDEDNEIPADNRTPTLGNGAYLLHPVEHEWIETEEGVGMFVAKVEVLDATDIGRGVQEHKGTSYAMTRAGEVSAIKIWGFGKKDKKGTHRMAVGKLKSYLAAALAHRGITEKGKHEFMKLAQQLVQAGGSEKAKNLFKDTAFRMRVEFKPPVSTSEDATPWPAISYPKE